MRTPSSRCARAELFDDAEHIENRINRFCDRFPNDKKHRWVKDLAAELLHHADPERVPLMNRWVWDAKSNTGVIREIWYGENPRSRWLRYLRYAARGAESVPERKRYLP
jgi:hypothetical protein